MPHAAPPAPHPVAEPSRDDPRGGPGRELSSAKPADRKRALKQLVAEGSLASWKKAFTALGDVESEVGDAAQLLLAEIDDAEVAAELAGKSGLAHKDAGPRLRAAEGLGRVACTIAVEPLLGALDDRETEVARLALWSVERLANAQHLGGDLERAASVLEHAGRTHREAGVRASATCARAALAVRVAHARADFAWDGVAQFFSRCLEDRDPRVRCAVASSARCLPNGGALLLLQPLAMDPRLSVRLARLETLEALASLPAVNALIAAFDTETAPRGRGKIVSALQQLSGLLHRDDPRPWRDWAKTLPPDWRPTLLLDRPNFEGGARAGAGGGEARTSAQVSFVGLPLVSARICFAIDFSGSMWTPMPDGRLPKELVDARLRATLESLTPATEFNIVPFTNEILPWRPKLVPANPANVRTAIADFEKCQAHGRGNYFDAAVFALDDPEVDTLLSLTDGIPTGGFHSDLELIVSLLLERNRFRHVAFDTVLVDAPSYAERRWRILSQFSGGRIVSTEKAE